MNASAHTLRRLASATGLALTVAALAIPTALARPSNLEGDTMIVTRVASGDARSPDTLDAATNAQAAQLDPAVATAIAAHERVQVSVDPRSPDTRDVAASLAVERPAVASPSNDPNGVDWGVLAVVLAAIGAMVVSIGALAVHGGKGTRSVRTS